MSKKKSNTGVFTGSIAGLGLVAFIAAISLTGCGSDGFDRTKVDDYIAAEPGVAPLGAGLDVYFDFSNGMNHAYASAEAQEVLKNVVNKLIGSNANAAFYSLASNEITPMTDLSQTAIYNAIVNPGSYTRQEAPIEKTLNEIVKNRKPALLVTDYEEYNNGVIQKSAYAKDAFISWLKEGYAITFYKWDFTENGKEKHLYMSVFDTGEGGLDSEVATAIAQSGTGRFIERYVLGGRAFPYAMMCGYQSALKGGTYHNSDGEDIVSGVVEDGSEIAYKNYSNPKAQASGNGEFLPVDRLSGYDAEYYPLTVSWSDIITNANALSEEGVPAEDKYHHFTQNLYISFSNQNGYKIDGIEARCFNIEPLINDSTGSAKEIEVSDMFRASMKPIEGEYYNCTGWNELYLDFVPSFTGTFAEKYGKEDDLLRVNIVISHATAELGDVEGFFGWPGNPSLSQSVTNTLTSAEVNPIGRILYSYFFKKL